MSAALACACAGMLTGCVENIRETAQKLRNAQTQSAPQAQAAVTGGPATGGAPASSPEQHTGELLVTAAREAQTAMKPADIVEHERASVLTIETWWMVADTGTTVGGASRHSAVPIAVGNALALDARGWLLTAAHVLDKADTVIATDSLGRKHKAIEWHVDKATDVGVIRIDTSDLRPIRTDPQKPARQGEEVVVYGKLLDLAPSVSLGSVAGVERYLPTTPQSVYIQIDATTGEGSSGAAVWNLQGTTIAMVSAVYGRRRVAAHRITFATEIGLARSIATTLIAKGSVTRGWTGMRLGRIVLEENVTGTEEIVVVDVNAGGPAQSAGIKREDRITHIAGTGVRTSTHAQHLLGTMSPGDSALVRIRRGNRISEHTLVLAEAPD